MAGTLLEEKGFETESPFLASPYIVQGTVRCTCTGLDKNKVFFFFFGGLECIGLSFALSPIYDF
jgi:hypothetical protein